MAETHIQISNKLTRGQLRSRLTELHKDFMELERKLESERNDHKLTVKELRTLEKRFEFEQELRRQVGREAAAFVKALVCLSEHLVEPPRSVAMALTASFDPDSKKWSGEWEPATKKV